MYLWIWFLQWSWQLLILKWILNFIPSDSVTKYFYYLWKQCSVTLTSHLKCSDYKRFNTHILVQKNVNVWSQKDEVYNTPANHLKGTANGWFSSAFPSKKKKFSSTVMQMCGFWLDKFAGSHKLHSCVSIKSAGLLPFIYFYF